MLGRLIVLAVILLGLLLLLDWFRRVPPHKVANILRKSVLYGAIGLVILLVATGRIPWLFAVVSAAIPVLIRVLNLVRLVPMIRQIMAQLGLAQSPHTAGGGRRSSIRTRFLDMTLEHATGTLDGRVLDGPMRGRRLSELELTQLLDLLATCRAEDGQSAAVLEAYLDRTLGDAWRDQPGAEGRARDSDMHGMMTREEAWAVLGLEPGADEARIREAHRRLMQKLHPDRGGSTYLAAKINQAKDILLET